MTFEELRRYLLSKPEAREDRPFGPTALVFKVLDKMFALVPLEAQRLYVSLKCD
ncbi:MAG: MmcQ/YjbR family DNA-binding protein, partial [Proteobacteria bacterium]|nr:MmcQ/YjbR family DNA-binding protein [Pseudomonadota bacterium]